MKSSLLVFLGLPILLGACNASTSTSAYIDTSLAVSAGTKDTKWGLLPSYEPAGHRFTGVSAANFGAAMRRRDTVLPLTVFGVLDTAVALKLDLLVNPDGTVRDVAIFESSSNPVLDKAAAAAFKNARYSLKLSPVDPAPHVVRLTMGVRIVANAGSHGLVNSSSLGSLGPQANYSGPPPANYSYSTTTP